MKIAELKEVIKDANPETKVILNGDKEGWHAVGSVKIQPLSDLNCESMEFGDEPVLNITREY